MSTEPSITDLTPKPSVVPVAAGCLGASAMVTQLVMMREALGAFHGDEMSLGIVLGNWLLLTGLGALAGRWLAGGRARAVLPACLLLAALLPPVMVFAMRAWKHLVFAPGVMAGPAQEFFATLGLLAPYCLVSGACLTAAGVALVEERGPWGITSVYLADTVGAIAGGAVFTFVLAARTDHFTALGLAGLACLGAAAWLAHERRQRVALAAAVISTALLIVFLLTSPETASARRQYAAEGQEFVARGRSPYGQLDVTRSGSQTNFVYNGQPLYSTGNRQQVEETVHFVLCERPHAARILLIGGGVTGTAQEFARRFAPVPEPRRTVTRDGSTVMRRASVCIDYVELDPLVVSSRSAGMADNIPAICRPVILTDGRLFLRQGGRQGYDIILLDLPTPAGAQMNRFYTAEFFRTAKAALAPMGVVAFALGESGNYIGPEQGAVLACLNRTLGEVFAHVKVLPGERYHFLASDGPLDGDLAAWSAGLNPPAEWIRPGWVEAMLTPDRLADVRRALETPAPMNRDLDPALCRLLLKHRLTEYKVTFGALEGALLLALIFYLARLKATPRAVLTVGFAAAALEFALLLGFQILYGSLYRELGLIVTLFMVGLATGVALAGLTGTVGQRRRLGQTAIAMGAFALIISAALAALNAAWLTGEVLEAAARAVIPLLTLALGALTGAAITQAAGASAGDGPRAASDIFTADFIGAALGALLASMLLIPLVGIFWTCALTAALNLASGALLLRRRAVV